MSSSQPLTSIHNPLLKDIRRALSQGTLTSKGYAVAETFHLLEEAQRALRPIPTVLAAESAEEKAREMLADSKALRILPDALFRQLPSTETSQGIIALVEPPTFTMDDILRGSLILVLDRIQDPGNAGTIVRTAEAFGATGAVFLKGSVNPWNPKTLRASAGSLFRFPVCLESQPFTMHPALRNLSIYAAVAANAKPIAEADFTSRCAIVIGSEAHGVSEAIRRFATPVTIPTKNVESLNAAVAASVMLYEAGRQRGRTA